MYNWYLQSCLYILIVCIPILVLSYLVIVLIYCCRIENNSNSLTNAEKSMYDLRKFPHLLTISNMLYIGISVESDELDKSTKLYYISAIIFMYTAIFCLVWTNHTLYRDGVMFSTFIDKLITTSVILTFAITAHLEGQLSHHIPSGIAIACQIIRRVATPDVGLYNHFATVILVVIAMSCTVFDRFGKIGSNVFTICEWICVFYEFAYRYNLTQSLIN